MLVFVFCERGHSSTFHRCSDDVLFRDGSMARGDGVNVFFVGRPEEGPVQIDNVPARSLLQDEFAQGIDGHASAADAADGWKARIVPTPDYSGFDELGELPFGEKCANEVHAGKVPDMNFAEVQSVEHPVVLRVTVPVFDGPQGMCDALHRVNNRAGEVVGWVNFPLLASTMVCLRVAAVDYRVSHCLVGVVHRHFGSDAHVTPSSLPFFISSKRARFSSMVASLRLLAIPCILSCCIVSRSVSSA